MYGFQDYSSLLPEDILQKVSQEDIFSFALGVEIDMSHRYISPFREDNRPGCRFEQREDGTLLFVDFGERLVSGRTHRNCFMMVMDKFQTSDLGIAIDIIARKFGLSMDKSEYDNTIPVVYERKKKSSSVEIEYEKRMIPLKSDIQYWSQYLITIPQIESDNVFCIRSFSLRGHKGYRVFNPYKYSYVMDFISRRKIYQPYAGQYKWISNCDEDVIGNFDNLPVNGRQLIISKSYKDHRVLRNMGAHNVIWLQNEGCVPSEEILSSISNRFEYITIFYDNDEGGVKAGYKLSDIFNRIRAGSSRVVYTPKLKRHHDLFDKYLKDPAEWINREGKQDLIMLLKQMGVLYG